MRIFSTLLLLVISLNLFSQTNPSDTIRVTSSDEVAGTLGKSKTTSDVVSDIEKVNATSMIKQKYNPTKAGLYSAVLPGLGQYYNKKYWKIPIVWGAVGTGVGIAMWNQKQYTKYRGYFVDKLNGTPNQFLDEHPWMDANSLGNIQDQAKRQRDYAIAITGLIYILNIVDAVVDAHLYEGRKDPDLAVTPAVIYDEFGRQNAKAGISLSYNF